MKYMEQLEPFYKTTFFNIEEAAKQGVPRHALAYLEKRGDLKRIYPGAYRFPEYEPEVEFQWENLGLVASSIPESVICLISALVFYGLTDQVMREIWLAMPHKSHPPKRPNTRIVRMRNIDLGQTTIALGEYRLQIFDRERCIIDAFHYLSKEIAIKALKKYFQSNANRLSPWRSTEPGGKLDYASQVMKWKQEFEDGRAIRFLMISREDPEGEIIGFCNFSQIFRVPFQACYLGYQLDVAHEGKGLMLEAIQKAVKYMFEEQNLYRIMANYMPSNTRSPKLLQNLGFMIEGMAKNYLLINGQWEDHVLTSLTNHQWIAR